MKKLLAVLLLATAVWGQQKYPVTARALRKGASDPATCAEGEIFYNTTTNVTKVCTSTNVWTTLASGGGSGDLLDAGTITALNAGKPVVIVDADTLGAGARTGNTTTFATADASAKTAGNYAQWDADGNLTGGGVLAALLVANNLSDLPNVPTARSNLGLGNAATKNTGTAVGTVAAGDDSRIVNAVQTARTVNGHPLSADVAVTASDLGLGNVDNTSDANKPISTLTQAALDGKAPNPVSTISATTGPITVTGEGFYWNNSTGAIQYNLPAASAGKRYCFRNYTTRTGTITIQAPASTYIDLDGANGAAAGYISSGGALGDALCVVASSGTQYVAYVYLGTWTNH